MALSEIKLKRTDTTLDLSQNWQRELKRKEKGRKRSLAGGKLAIYMAKAVKVARNQ